MNHAAGPYLNLNWHWIWLIAAAFLGGTLNAVAGGGSLLLFPAMLGMGIPPIQANATNTVALWPGQLTSAAAYRSDVQRHWRLAILLGFAGLVGGTAGATLLLHTPQRMFLHLVPWLLFTASSIFAISGPVSRWLVRRKEERSVHGEPHGFGRISALVLSVTAVCFYIGYFGAGAGFVLMTVLVLFGFEDLHEVNALKVVSTLMANGMAFVMFVLHGQVEWHYCLLAMVVCGIGGYTSARLARKIPQPILRAAVVLFGFSMSAFFFWKVG
ncbi:MAG TPA: sulfite exporter TauE/SafE family protein [Terracidiphilus sp.]|nr:sulfite exporter TauE/SafE family protein [Terracidiphilus sp.]